MGYWINGYKEDVLDRELANATTRTVRLYTVLPDEDGSGGTECSGNGYSAQTMTGMGAASTDGGNVTTALNDEAPAFTADGGDIAGIVGWGIELDAVLAFVDEFAAPITIADGTTKQFAIGALGVTLS